MSKHALVPFVLTAFACLVPICAQEATAPDQNGKTVTLSVAEMKRQMGSCKPEKIKRGLLPKGTIVPVRVSVDAAGKIVDLGPAERCPVGCGLLAEPIISIKKCKFTPLTVDGHNVEYSGNVELVAP